MKNLITLKKFCLVVAIVGLLHTIVDAEELLYEHVQIHNNSSIFGAVMASDDTRLVNAITGMSTVDFLKKFSNLDNDFIFNKFLVPGYKYNSPKPVIGLYDSLAELRYTTLINTLIETYRWVVMSYIYPEFGKDIRWVSVVFKLNDGKYAVIVNCQEKNSSN